MADWSMLPDDLLRTIAFKLESPQDFIYFSVVCHSWNNFSSMVKPEWVSDKLNTPWLLLAEPEPFKDNTKENPQYHLRKGRRTIFSIGENKCYEYNLPQTLGARCWGSAYGWIVMLHPDKQILLFNPLTKAQLSLPPLLENLEIYDGIPPHGERFLSTVRRFIVLKIPQKDRINEDEFVVMVIYCIDHLAFSRPGDQAWTGVLTPFENPYQVSDVFYWNGLVLILYEDGALASCDVGKAHNGYLPSDFVEAKEYLPAPPGRFFSYSTTGLEQMYMAELDGDLHVVSRYRITMKDENEKLSYRTCAFEIYSLDYKTKVWKNVDDLGDYMLFVGNNTTVCVHKSNIPECPGNVIYFTDDEIEFWCDTETRGRDMGVYDVKSWKTKTFYDGDHIMGISSAPLWFIPKF